MVPQTPQYTPPGFIDLLEDCLINPEVSFVDRVIVEAGQDKTDKTNEEARPRDGSGQTRFRSG
jgi:hypothetical protein